jgi:hypothetical protein
MNDDYIWPLRIVTDYAGDRVSISDGSLKHYGSKHAASMSALSLDSIEGVLVCPAGGVYLNPPAHDHPHRLNYYSAPDDTDDGSPLYVRVVVDKVVDPHKVITAYSTDRIGLHGGCIYPETTEDK